MSISEIVKAKVEKEWEEYKKKTLSEDKNTIFELSEKNFWYRYLYLSLTEVWDCISDEVYYKLSKYDNILDTLYSICQNNDMLWESIDNDIYMVVEELE